METQPVVIPILEFTHHGVQRTLVKHPAYVRALKDGALPLAEFRFKPWTLRFEVNGVERKFKLSNVDKDAIRQAKDILTGQRDRPSEFTEWMSDRDAKRTVSLGDLAKEWRELKCPDHNGRPRSPASIQNLEAFLTSALRWWKDVPVGIVETKFAEFITWRRANSKRGNGERAADLEINALGCLCRWAVFACKIETNPFRGRKQGGTRPRFRSPDDVAHCYEAMPASDEEFHRVLSWFWQSRPGPANAQHAIDERRRIIAGAWLAWCSLVGLRPGEPGFLLRRPTLAVVPGNPKQVEPGTVFPTRDGKLKMKVQRFKRGQNPFIALHSAAVEFLAAWNGWLNANMPNTVHLFPDPIEPSLALCLKGDRFLNAMLERACVDCKIASCKPHGFGRGYYVRVRRSQGAEDPTIAGELGQSSNGKLIRDTYGDPDDMVGGALFDWLPENDKQERQEPAWKLLTVGAVPSNVISI